MRKILLVFICTILLYNCSNMNKQDVGTLAGGATGALLGSTIGNGSGRVLAIAAGTLAGAYLGGAIGQSMDENDRMRLSQALDNNAIGAPAYWSNQRTHHRYQVVPTKNITIGHNRYCREYRTTAEINGKKQIIYGKACRQPDGSWQVRK